MEEPRGTEAPTAGVVDTAARGASQSRATAPAALLTRTVGADGFIKWRIARPRGRWRVMKVAAVAAAGLGVGYFALARDERAIDTTSRAAPARPALAGPVAVGQVVAPVGVEALLHEGAVVVIGEAGLDGGVAARRGIKVSTLQARRHDIDAEAAVEA